MGAGCGGYQSQLALKEHTPVYLNRVNRLIDEIGIPIAMASAYPDFTHPDALQRERAGTGILEAGYRNVFRTEGCNMFACWRDKLIWKLAAKKAFVGQ